MEKEKAKIIRDICPFYKEYGSCERCDAFTLRERDGLTLKYNEETGEWDKYEVYMSVDCQTEEDFAYLKECVEKQQAKKPCEIKDDWTRVLVCPNCKNPVINYYNRKINPPHCMMCGQKLDWGEG